jgi:methylmalonyl-CoA mutase C-terminal domain/subunit
MHPPKILVTKIGLDGHDRGSRVVAAFLRDAGMEVLYTPPWQEIAQVIRLAEEEDVDVIGISSLATDHLLVPKLMKALKKARLEHVPVVVGGIVPDEDERKLRKAGVREVFHPGASREEIVSKVAKLAEEARAAREQEALA